MSVRFYEFGPFRIDKLNHTLLRDGKAVPLKPKVFDTLLLLVENRDRVLDKDELISCLWPDTVVEESNLSQNIYLLRKVLGEGANGDVYISTLPKRGYRFVATVNEISDETAAVIPPVIPTETNGYIPSGFSPEQQAIAEKALVPSRFEKRSFSRNVSWVAIILCALGVSLVFTVSYLRNKNRITTPASRVQSLAVLPFQPFDPNAGDVTLRFGMADTLITRLNNLNEFQVRPLSTVLMFRWTEQDPLRLGRQLQVDAVLDTSMHKDGDWIRIALQLMRVSDGTILWTTEFEHKADDLPGLEDHLAEQVAQALIPQMTAVQKKLLAKRYTENVEAWQLHMTGRYQLSTMNPADWDKAIEYFQRAIDKDPSYALAHSDLSFALFSQFELAHTEAMPKARQAAMTALLLDNTLAAAHQSLARIRAYYDWDWTGAEGEFKRAIELNPNSSQARAEYAFYLIAVLRSGEAVEEAKRARELDPTSFQANFSVISALLSAHYYDSAITESRELRGAYWAGDFFIGYAYLAERKYDLAAPKFQSVLAVIKDWPFTNALLGYVYAVSGRQNEARKILAELTNPSQPQQLSPYLVAIVYAGLDDRQQTFAWLERAYHERSPMLADLRVNPVWDNYRLDPRFTSLLRRIGLSQ